jgi:hypothetical protein
VIELLPVLGAPVAHAPVLRSDLSHRDLTVPRELVELWGNS